MTNPLRRADVIIVGGGPAGASAAALLARAHASVVLLNRIPSRYRAGEVLDSLAIGLLEKVGVPLADVLATATKVTASTVEWNSSARTASPITNPHGAALLLDRGAFDTKLRHTAIRARTEVREFEQKLQISQIGGQWCVEASTSDAGYAVQAPLLIDCTGRSRAVVRRYGKTERVDRLVCDYFLTLTRAADSQWRIAPHENGWWFTAPADAGLRVFCHFHDPSHYRAAIRPAGAAIVSPFPGQLEKESFEIKSTWRVDASTSIVCVDEPNLASAGDAAFAIDPLSGHGVASAIAQGVVVAASCLALLGGGKNAFKELRAFQRHEYCKMLKQRTASYSNCIRWPSAFFWKQRHQGGLNSILSETPIKEQNGC